MRRLHELHLVDLLVAFVIATSAVLLLQLVLGRFEPIYALFIALLGCGAAGLAFVRSVSFPHSARIVLGITLIGMLALMLRWNPFLYVEGGQDQGIYVAMSSHFARTQGIGITDQVRARLPAVDKAEYDRLNNRYFPDRVEMPGLSEGEHQPGVFIADLAHSRYVFSFYPLHPAWMAVAAKVFGEENRVYSLVAFSLLGILMVSLLAYELADRRPGPALLVAGLLTLNPMHVFLSRFPVSENMTLFFSATCFYYLVRYFKTRETVPDAPFDLALSAGAWGCLFFTHLSGFLYTPLILAVVVTGAVTAPSLRLMHHLLAYAVALSVGLGLSIWYGFTWSFPYTFGTYRRVFGLGFTSLLRDYLPLAIAVFTASAAGIMLSARRHRSWLRAAWSMVRFDRIACVLLLVVVVASLLNSFAEGYGLGFTKEHSLEASASDPRSTDFAAAGENWLNRLSQLSGSGINGLLHSSAAALAIYVSPFILAFVLAAWFVRRRSIDAYEFVLLLLITEFMVLRVGAWNLTLYYYYGRYLAVELVPYVLLLAALWGFRLATEGTTGPRKALAAGVLAAAFVWEAVALAPQYPGGEMHRLDASMQPLVRRIGQNDVLLLSGIDNPALRTSLDYYYGRRAIVVDAGRLPDFVRKYSTVGSDIYVMSPLAGLTDLSYIGAVTLVRSGYAKGTASDVLPMNSSSSETRYYLYRAERSDLARLREGDVIAFGRQGNEEEYLGAGWSSEEEQMRWTDGRSAVLRLPFVEAMTRSTLSFEVLSHKCVGAGVLVNEELRTRWTFADCGRYLTQTVTLRREDVHQGVVTLAIEMPEAKSPHELDPANPDQRRLGLSVRRIVVGVARTALQGQPASPALRAGDVVPFDKRGMADPFLGSGWSGQEETMRWTEGKSASLQLPFDESMTVATLAFEVLPHNCIPVDVKINDADRAHWTFSDCTKYTTHTVVVKREDARQGFVRVSFETPDAKSPQELDPSNADSRKLGISVRTMTVAPGG